MKSRPTCIAFGGCKSPATPGRRICEMHLLALQERAAEARAGGSRWTKLDALMKTACERCGLRGQHECLQTATSVRSGREAVVWW